MSIQVAVSLGEFLDKLSILEIKAERIQYAAKVANVLAAGGRPLVSLFGPTNAAKFAHGGGQRSIIRAQEFGGPEMERIPLDAVSATVQPLLAASG